MATEIFSAKHTAGKTVFFRFYDPVQDKLFDFDDDTWQASPVDEKLAATEKTAMGDADESLYVASQDLDDLYSTVAPRELIVQAMDDLAMDEIISEESFWITDGVMGLPAVGDVVADEVITGGNHNVTNSMGRRIRELDEQIGYEGAAVWVDTIGGAPGTVEGENGTVSNPSSNITDALTIAVAAGRVRLRVASGSTITLLAALEGYEIYNNNWTLVLNGQSVSGSCIMGAAVSGVCTGANPPSFIDCHFANTTLPPSHLRRCGFGGTITAGSAGDFFFDLCHSSVAGTSAPVFDFGAGLGASNMNYRHYSGGIEIRNMGAGAGSYNMSLEGWGQLIINANCSATSTVAIRGSFTVTDNASGAVTLSDDARIDIGQIHDLEDGIETSITPRQAQRLILAAVAGKLSGAETTTIVIRNVGDTKDRITATVDIPGNRSAVTVDAT